MAIRIFPRRSALPIAGQSLAQPPESGGLVAAYAPAVTGAMWDLAFPFNPPIAGQGGGTLGGGAGLIGGGSATAPSQLKLNLSFTIVCRVAFTSTPTANQSIFGLSYNSGFTTPFLAYSIGVDASGFIRLAFNSAGTFAEWNGGVSGRVLASNLIGRPTTIAGLFTGGGVTIYIGMDEGWFQSTARSNPNYTTTSLLHVGANLAFEFGLIYNRRLSPPELRLFRDDPYHWLSPAQFGRWAIGAGTSTGGGGGDTGFNALCISP